MPLTAVFETHRRHLRALAYRMLGSRAEAEDVVQECWLRWHGADAGAVVEPRAWLSRVATRLCLDRLQSAAARREQYVGVWLPEPLVDADAAAFDPGPEARAEYAQQVSNAFLLALERLRPLERAAFLLHDVFDLDFDEIGARLGREAAACRQLAHRARAHVRAEPARVDVADAEAQRLLQVFAQAVASGDVAAFAAALAHDAQMLSDGGGKVHAVPTRLQGARRVAQALIGFARKWDPRVNPARIARVNGEPGIVIADAQGRVFQTMALQLGSGADGHARIAAIYIVRNPDKLRHLNPPAGPAGPLTPPA